VPIKEGGKNIQTVITDTSYSIVLVWCSVDKVRVRGKERGKCKKNGGGLHNEDINKQSSSSPNIITGSSEMR